MSKKKNYRIRSWSEYNKVLIKRGRLTLWFDVKSIENWLNFELSGKQGRSNIYSDVAIECMLTLVAVVQLPLRSAQGWVMSIVEMLNLPIQVLNYSTVSRRQDKLDIVLKSRKSNEALHGVFDSTGLKIFVESERF